MFSFHVPLTKQFIFKKLYPLFFTLSLAALLFAGCDWGGDTTGAVGGSPGNVSALAGTWKDPRLGTGDAYVITTGNNSISYISGYQMGDFTGTIAYVENFTPASGVIIFRYTSGQPASGRTYGAVYYKELQGKQMRMSTAGLWTDSYEEITPVIRDLEAAKKEFTLARGEGYYAGIWGGPYVKQ
jgi:hypothetical protein